MGKRVYPEFPHEDFVAAKVFQPLYQSRLAIGTIPRSGLMCSGVQVFGLWILVMVLEAFGFVFALEVSSSGPLLDCSEDHLRGIF